MPPTNNDQDTQVDERTPLIRANSDTEAQHAKKLAEHEALYRRFNPRQKKILVLLVACTGLIPLFVSGSFIPSIPQIAHDLNSTGSVVNLAVSLSFFSGAIGMLIWASYSTFYGRRPVYLAGLPLLVIGSVGVGLSRTIPELLVWRIIQSFGASGGLSLGTAVIGDIYKLEERGTAMGIFFGAVLIGPALAPVAGGTAAHYASWRVMQFALAIAGAIMFTVLLLFLPETSQPGTRGVEKLENRRFVLLNPLKSIALLKSPNLLAVMISGSCALLTDYVLLVPFAYTIGAKYNITNEAIIGACFLPCGLGNLIGAPLAGRLSDHILVSWRKKRNGIYVPEDRLRATMVGAFFLVPLSVLAFGLTATYIDGTPGFVISLLCLFMNGLGVDFVLSPSGSYGVDIMHHRSAEMMAANNSIRSVIISFSVAGILPLVDAIGIAWANAIAAVIAWIGAIILWYTIKYGDRMRSWVDMEYTVSDETN